MHLQLPTWIIKTLEETFGGNRSSQYYIKKLLVECINTEQGRRIIERIKEEENRREGI